MIFIDQLLLVGTFLLSGVAVWQLVRQRSTTDGIPSSDYYHLTALTVLGIAALLLAVFSWGILGLMGNGTSNKLVAIVSSLIPFSWATGLISRFYSRLEKPFLVLMVIGLLLIAISRFIEAPLMSRIVYPVFHSTAAIVVIITPLLAFKNGLVNWNYLLVSVGGLLISMGGITMSFLSAGKQLLFFSQEVVLMILAPLLFITGLLYHIGLSRGKRVN